MRGKPLIPLREGEALGFFGNACVSGLMTPLKDQVPAYLPLCESRCAHAKDRSEDDFQEGIFSFLSVVNASFSVRAVQGDPREFSCLSLPCHL